MVKHDPNPVLHNMYYLLKDSLSRRTSYAAINGSTQFPLKLCSTGWLENNQCFVIGLLSFVITARST